MCDICGWIRCPAACPSYDPRSRKGSDPVILHGMGLWIPEMGNRRESLKEKTDETDK